MCTLLQPLGVNLIAVNKYINVSKYQYLLLFTCHSLTATHKTTSISTMIALKWYWKVVICTILGERDVLNNDTVTFYKYSYIASMVGEWIENRDYFWNDSDRGKWKSWDGGGEDLSHQHSVHHTPHMHWPRTLHRPLLWVWLLKFGKTTEVLNE